MILLATASSPAQTTAASTATVKYPVIKMHVSQHITGNCWTTSIASTRSDAFRCMAGNSIEDPCFELNKTTVACPTDPFKNNGIVMQLDKPLPPAQSPGPPQAFAMLLQSGAKCNRATGTVVADYPYYCSGETSVCQGPDLSKKQAAYYVKCGTPKDAMHVDNVSSVAVKTIYE
jgi:hypothetical protein